MNFLKKLLAKASEYVKLTPWLQYVGLQASQIPTLHEWAKVVALAASFGFFMVNKAFLGPNDPKLREFLAYAGYPLAAIGLTLNNPDVMFVGAALVMTEFVYELIYP